MAVELDMMLGTVVALDEAGLTVMGAGWMVRPPGSIAGPSAIGCIVRIPRDQPGMHQIRVELLDSDGDIVVVNPPDGPGPLVFEVEFQAGGLAGLTIPFTAPIGFQLPPFPLPRGSEYRWRAFVDGETRESWTLPFRTTPPKAPQAKPGSAKRTQRRPPRG
jgi:hypothetical protein